MVRGRAPDVLDIHCQCYLDFLAVDSNEAPLRPAHDGNPRPAIYCRVPAADFVGDLSRLGERLGGLNRSSGINFLVESRVTAYPRLVLTGAPQLLARPPERPSESSNSDGGDGPDEGAVVVKSFSDMPPDDQHRVVGGAIFLIGLFLLSAYLAVSRIKD